MNDKDRSDDYHEATIELAAESRDIFPTFEDDQALSYYEPDCNGCETDIQGHDFRSPTTLPYELVMTREVEDCLEKISEHDGGGGSLDDDVFCVVTSGELIIDRRKQTESILASQGFNLTENGRNSRIFGVGEPTEGMPKAKPKPCQNGKNGEMDGLLAKAPVRRRLAPGTCNTRRRRGTDALPTGGCPQLEYLSYVSNAQLVKAHLPSYDSSPIIASSSLLSRPFNYSTSENVNGGQRGFSGHIMSPSYQVSTVNQEELQYLDEDEYHQLVSSDELRMMNLSGDQTVVHDQSVELEAITDYHTGQSVEVWQQPFTDEFKLMSDSGCFQQPKDPGGMQWCTISSSDFRQTPPCSRSTSTVYATPRASDIGQQNLNFRVPWHTPSPAPSPSNAPLDMTSAIINHQNASLLLQSPQPLKFAAPMSLASGDPTNGEQLAAHNFRQMTRPPVRRQRRKPARTHSTGTTQSVVTPSMNPQQESTDGSGLTSNGKLTHGPGSYHSDISLTQRQMPGLLPSDRLELTTREEDRFADPGRLDLEQSNKENNMNSGVEWTSVPVLAQSPRLHQLQNHSPVQRRPKLTTDTNYMSTVISASGNSVPNLITSDAAAGQIQTGHPTSLDRGSLENIVQNTTNNASSSLAALPFPLPAVPPGYRLVITHHPLPTENEQEPQHITQLIIDNPSTSYQASPNLVPCTLPYPGNNVAAASEVSNRLTGPRDVGRPTRPNTLDLLPQATNQVTPTAVFSRISVDGRTGNGTGSGLITMKTEPPSPLDGGVHNGPPASGVVNQVILRPNAGQGIPPSPSPGEDLLEMSMREANVLQLASTHRGVSGERGQVFTKRGSIGGHYGQSLVSTPMSSDSSGGGGGSGSSRGTPFLEGFPVGDALLPLNLTGSKSILVNSAGVPTYPFEVNNNSVQVGCRSGVIGSFSGSNTPSGAQSSDEWSRAWGPGMSISDVDGSAAFQDENQTVMFVMLSNEVELKRWSTVSNLFFSGYI